MSERIEKTFIAPTKRWWDDLWDPAKNGVGEDGKPEVLFFRYYDLEGYRFYCDPQYAPNGSSKVRPVYDYICVSPGEEEGEKG